MTPETLRRRLSGPAETEGPIAVGPQPEGALVPAAVLVAVALGMAPGVLLTKRTAHLRRHSGQVSFPGGRIDAGDPSAEAAALREAQEEVGIDPGQVEILGRLPDFVTGTGFRITPVLALLAPGVAVAASPHEVAEIFRLDLAVLLDPAAPRRRQVTMGGEPREMWFWPHPRHDIWGATAAILVHLAQRLRREEKNVLF